MPKARQPPLTLEWIPMADDNFSPGSSDIEALLQRAQAAGAPQTTASGTLNSDEVTRLLQGVGGASRPQAAPAANSPHAVSGANPAVEGRIAQGDIDYLFNQAEQALASVQAPVAPKLEPPVTPFRFEDFAATRPTGEAASLELIRDVELDLKIELGRTHMYLEDVLKLRKGSVVPLDKLAGDPVDVYVNGRLIARGEVLVLNDNFCVRVAELISSDGSS